MTKDQLREALHEVGVSTPAKTKKAALVKLYREKVLNQDSVTVSPNDSLIGGFSSDEEDVVHAIDTSHITSDTNIDRLSNDEIFYKLKELGENVGPILDSTRTIYARKLAKVLGSPGAFFDETYGGRDSDKSHDISAYSADEDEEEQGDGADKDLDNLRGRAFLQMDKRGGIDTKFEGLLDRESANIQSTRSYHEKVQEQNGSTVRSRKLHTTRSYVSGTDKADANGKTFIPPPPKKTSHIIYAVLAVLILVAVAVLVWFNLEAGQSFTTVPVAANAPASGGSVVPPSQPVVSNP